MNLASGVRPSTFSNNSYETVIGPIIIKFHMETTLDGGTCPGHMTKMAAMHIYDGFFF